MFPREIRREITTLFLLSLGGFLLHLKLHPVSFDPSSPENPAHLIPFVTGILGVIAVPALLGSKKTATLGYLINGMSVVIGAIVMVHFTLAAPPYPVTWTNIFLYTTVPYIALLLPKLLIGQSVLISYYPRGRGRMFTTGWWIRHFCYLTAFYLLGHSIWR